MTRLRHEEPRWVVRLSCFAALAVALLNVARMRQEAREGEPVARRVATRVAGASRIVTPPRASPEPAAARDASRAEPSADAANAVVRASLEQGIGLTRLPVGHTGRGDVVLRLELAVTGACHEGDVDAIARDLAAAGDPPLLLTVESLLADDLEPPLVALALTREELLAGVQTEAVVPQDGGARQLGVFLCRDAAGEGRCGGKRAAQLASPDEPAASAADRIFYFQYLHVGRGEARALGEDVLSTEVYDLLGTYARLDAGEDAGRAAAEVARARELMTAVRSAEPVPVEDAVRLVLPRFSPEACAH